MSSKVSESVNVSWRRDMTFIGSQFSNRYTAVDTPAKAAWCACVRVCVRGVCERVVQVCIITKSVPCIHKAKIFYFFAS